MKVFLKKIEEKDYNKMESKILFSDKVSNKCFGVINNGIIEYRLSWYSDLVEPVITNLSPNVYSIGIDQNFAIIDFEKELILLKSNLDYNFINVKILFGFIYLITELEITKLDRITFNKLEEYGLPDFFEEIILQNNHIIVKCLGDLSISIG